MEIFFCAPVAQLDRASASGAEGCEFDPRQAHHPPSPKAMADARRNNGRTGVKEGSRMYYVYLIKSVKFPEQKYVGRTTDVERRLTEHNNGDSPHTSKYRPWEMECFIAFKDKAKACQFESYLKSGSGRAFAARHLC